MNNNLIDSFKTFLMGLVILSVLAPVEDAIAEDLTKAHRATMNYLSAARDRVMGEIMQLQSSIEMHQKRLEELKDLSSTNRAQQEAIVDEIKQHQEEIERSTAKLALEQDLIRRRVAGRTFNTQTVLEMGQDRSRRKCIVQKIGRE